VSDMRNTRCQDRSSFFVSNEAADWGAVYFRYCSSLTCSIQSTGLPFSTS
jgi:hypothetical protein